MFASLKLGGERRATKGDTRRRPSKTMWRERKMRDEVRRLKTRNWATDSSMSTTQRSCMDNSLSCSAEFHNFIAYRRSHDWSSWLSLARLLIHRTCISFEQLHIARGGKMKIQRFTWRSTQHCNRFFTDCETVETESAASDTIINWSSFMNACLVLRRLSLRSTLWSI